MAEFVGNCPRCRVRSVTFSVRGDAVRRDYEGILIVELLGLCRNCERCSIGVFGFANTVSQTHTIPGYFTNQHPGSLSTLLRFDRFISVADEVAIEPPEHLPEAVANCFREGAAAFAIGAYNAAAAMFRLALDIATKGLLPDTSAEEGGPNSVQRRRLYDRLAYLFNTRLIAPELTELADCVREDGNDGAHDGTLTRADAEDLIDFTEQLLERVYTEPARLRIAKARRDARRAIDGAP